MRDFIENTHAQIFNDFMSKQIGQVDESVLQYAGQDQYTRKQEAHTHQSFRLRDDDVFINNDIDKIGLKCIQWCQYNGEKCAEIQ